MFFVRFIVKLNLINNFTNKNAIVCLFYLNNLDFDQSKLFKLH